MDQVTLSTVLARGETQHIEFKGAIGFQDDFRAHLAASITCMCNTPNGGTIIIGISKEVPHRVLGLGEKDLKSYDPTIIANYLSQRVTPLPRFNIETVSDSTGTVLLIHVAEFEEVPTIVTKQIADSQNKVYAREGDILVRSQGCECRRVKSAEEINELLARGMAKKSERLLEQMRVIITGVKPTEPEKSPAELHAELLPHWNSNQGEFVARREGLAHFEVRMIPLPQPRIRLEPNSAVDLIKKSSVNLRGWDFPQLNRVTPTYFPDYIQVRFQQDNLEEVWQFSYRGAFGWLSPLWHELVPQSPHFNYPPPPYRVIDDTEILWSFTEIYRFATTLCVTLECDSIWVSVALKNIQERRLGTFETLRAFLMQGGVAPVPEVVISDIYQQADLISSWKERVIDAMKYIYTVFQMPNARRETIATQQQKLLERRS